MAIKGKGAKAPFFLAIATVFHQRPRARQQQGVARKPCLHTAVGEAQNHEPLGKPVPGMQDSLKAAAAPPCQLFAGEPAAARSSASHASIASRASCAA